MSAGGASDAASGSVPSRTTEMRRAVQGVVREGRDVAAGHEHDRAAILEHARVCFGDHLKPLHEGRYVTLADFMAQGMQTFISAEEIQQRVRALAADVSRDHPDGVHFVCVLKGAFVLPGRSRPCDSWTR